MAEKKQFQTESKKLLDMMINSIYTHKEIFLRELISNASDALDKLYFRSLTETSLGVNRGDLAIDLAVDEKTRTITITDNGCGMTPEELENNLGTIAKSGSFDFKQENEKKEDVDIIGQFGVGFYSAFMVADRITVITRAVGSSDAWIWESEGVEGYTVEKGSRDEIGTTITLHLKDDTEDEKYGEYLQEYRIRELVRKYSDYIRYPIRMEVETSRKKQDSDEYETIREVQTLNSMTPLWKKNPTEVSQEEYEHFYQDKFYDFEKPTKTIHVRAEGLATYEALLFIPARAPYNYYTTDYEKGLQLYSSGVMIMEKCADLIPDHFGFVRGLVDSADLSLNISREMLQHDRQLKVMAKAIDKKIRAELEKLMNSDRAAYEKFFDAFGLQLKFGLYSEYGMHKDELKDLVMFRSSLAQEDKKYVTLKEYLSRMPESQTAVYYACGETVDKIALLPQVESVRGSGFEVLYLTDDVDEFAIKMLAEYEGKKFTNVCTEKLDLGTDEEKEALKKENEDATTLFDAMKEALAGAVSAVRFTNTLGSHPVSLSSEGELSVEMEKVLGKMPGGEENRAKATLVLEINASHPVADKLRALAQSDKSRLADYTKILYAQARLINGLTIDNPAEISALVCGLM
ncbi:MAG: molecular chaperone HtpG [Clostridia bacterium]|nr:molecular chaperone HtpG [Clostridia bacterium]